MAAGSSTVAASRRDMLRHAVRLALVGALKRDLVALVRATLAGTRLAPSSFKGQLAVMGA